MCQNKQLFRTLVGNAPVGIFLADLDGACQFVNKAFCRLTGRRMHDLLGVPWFATIHPQDRSHICQSWFNAVRAGIPWQGEHRHLDCRGNLRWIAVSAAPLRDKHGKTIAYVTTAADITQRKNAEQHTIEQSLHDSLTSLPNRAYFLSHLNQVLSENAQSHLAILFLDLDHFKSINDTYGHAIGDALLKSVAERLRLCIADLPDDLADHTFVARLAGDEFTILLRDISIEQARQIAARWLCLLAEPYVIEGQHITAHASVGIAQGLSTDINAEEIIRCADDAMYRAKAQGEGRVEIFMPRDRRKCKRISITSKELKAAIEHNELSLDYQPIVRMDTFETNALEVLVRWRRKTGSVPPWRLIALAEESALIETLSQWILHHALHQLKIWRQTHPQLNLHFNISGHQLANGDHLLNSLETVLAENSLPAEAVGLDIPENVVVGKTSLECLERLRALGISIFLDNFGGGQLGFASLYRLPLNGMKLDPHLVDGAEIHRHRGAVVRSMVHLAHDLSIHLVAKGIEQRPQLEFLRAIGCPAAQGYAIVKPMSAQDASDYLSQQLSEGMPGARGAA